MKTNPRKFKVEINGAIVEPTRTVPIIETDYVDRSLLIFSVPIKTNRILHYKVPFTDGDEKEWRIRGSITTSKELTAWVMPFRSGADKCMIVHCNISSNLQFPQAQIYEIPFKNMTETSPFYTDDYNHMLIIQEPLAVVKMSMCRDGEKPSFPELEQQVESSETDEPSETDGPD